MEKLFRSGERLSPQYCFTKEEYFLLLRHQFPYFWIGENIIPSYQPTHILEIGAGEGYGGFLLAQKFSQTQFFNLDLNFKVLQLAQEKYNSSNLHFIQGNALSLPFLKNSFPLIFSFQVIEHLPPTQLQSFLIQIKNTLKEDGLLFLTTPNGKLRIPEGKKPWNPYHYQEFHPQELEKILFKHFKFVKIGGIRAIPYLEKIEQKRVALNQKYFYHPPKNKFQKLWRFYLQKGKEKMAKIAKLKKYWQKYGIKDFFLDFENPKLGMDLFIIASYKEEINLSFLTK